MDEYSKGRYAAPREDASTDQVEAVLAGGSSFEKCQAMVDAVFSCLDPEWLQCKALELSESEDPELRRIACVVVGHLGFRYPGCVMPAVMAMLSKRLEDPPACDAARNALEDIEIGRVRSR